MHDFCFTIPYGLILVAGGVIGFAKKGSIASFAGGSGTGFLLLLAGYLSLKAFEKRKNSYLAMFLETGAKSGFFSKNLPHRHCRIISRLLKISIMPTEERYLGTNLFFHRSKAQTFLRIEERISARLQSWFLRKRIRLGHGAVSNPLLKLLMLILCVKSALATVFVSGRIPGSRLKGKGNLPPRSGVNMENRLLWVSHFIDPIRRTWRHEELFTWCEDTSATLISHIYIPREGNLDELKWIPSKDGKFSIKSTYRALMSGSQMDPVLGSPSFLLRFWKNKASPWGQMFAWKCFRDMIPCQEKIAVRLSLNRYLLSSLPCPDGDSPPFPSGILLHQAEHLTTREWIEMWLLPPSDWPIERETWTAITFSLYWLAWKARCAWTFQATKPDPNRISLAINKIIDNEPVFRNERMSIKVPWAISVPGWEKINVDASFCKDKYFNCIGLVIRDTNNVFGAARISLCKFASAEEGEAVAVLAEIQWARGRGHMKNIIETDAEAIFSFCKMGGANISWTTKAILQDCLTILDTSPDICICFAPRSANSIAHIMASRPMGDSASWTWYDSPPELLHPYLEEDGTTYVTHFAY
ncbi:hypothetical protein GIB67_011425 [Kingdonia uniflora]|uniref:RNase H type-1 domain-containing protein n=1 Tax=Kingdonia uniflora TaxID=39325 RepID=A0A7J7NLZ5_9MAGN|nr:hypothetical protein GIB67_011425 [Kingdonia uniflora]